MSKLIFVLMLLVSMNVFATNNKPSNTYVDTNTQNVNTNQNNLNNVANGGDSYANGGTGIGVGIGLAHGGAGGHGGSATSSSNQGQLQGQSMNGHVHSSNTNVTEGSTAGSNSGGNNMTINSVNNQVRQAPSMALFTPPPTSPCVVTYGGSGSGAGIGISITGGIRNENCEKLEVAKALSAIGQLDASLEMICNTEHAKNEKLSVCERFKQGLPATEVVAKAPGDYSPPLPEVIPGRDGWTSAGTTPSGTKMAKDAEGNPFWFNQHAGQWVALYAK